MSIITHGGSELLAKYNDSLHGLLVSVFPEYPYFTLIDYLTRHNWVSSKFNDVPHQYWDDISHQRLFMDKFAKKLNITSEEQWHTITWATLKRHGASVLLSKYNGSVSKLMSTVYPEYRQTCRKSVLKLVEELKLMKVQHLITVPREYPCTHSSDNQLVTSISATLICCVIMETPSTHVRQ